MLRCTAIPDEPQHSKPGQSRPDRTEANHLKTALSFFFFFFAQI